MFANFSISELRDRVQQLSMREQLLVILVVGAAIYFLIDALVFSSQKQRQQDIDADLSALQSQVKVLTAQISVVERTRADELEQKQQEYRTLQQQVKQLDAVSGSVTAEVPKIAKLVGDVLGAAPTRVRAVGVKTVPVKALFTSKSTGSTPNAASTPPIYKHGLDIELRGSYLDLLNYLNKLEDAHAKLFWSNATFSAGTYPDNTLRASVFMLSTQPNL